MIALTQLLTNISCTVPCKDTYDDRTIITGIASDSRQVNKGNIFVAIQGGGIDGHLFLEQAVNKGCIAVVVEKDIPQILFPEVLIIRVQNTRSALGMLASAFYGHPARQMKMIGITGTNGKTTTSWVLENILQANQFKTGIIGTVSYRYTDKNGCSICQDAPLTTPEPIMLHQLLKKMADNEVSHVIMEVSSHALVQQRTAGIFFDVGIFTNLSRDHLDFHKTMENYFTAKQQLFLNHLKPSGTAVLVKQNNISPTDPHNPSASWDQQLAEILHKNKFTPFSDENRDKGEKLILTCGFDTDNDISATNIRLDAQQTAFDLSIHRHAESVQSPLTGRFNILNILCATGAAYALGLSSEIIQNSLAQVSAVPGRLEAISLPEKKLTDCIPTVFVDFAHSPDSLENVLKTLRTITNRKLICIFGCGGDRDTGKRPLMGAISGRLADITLLTSDNPRSESPANILTDIEKGLERSEIPKKSISQLFMEPLPQPGYMIIPDRRSAIFTACSLASSEDVILIAGKGHETYQITGNTKVFFDDRQEALNGLLCWNTDHLLRATNGILVNGRQKDVFRNITTDSRKISQNEIFIALIGENFDGHDYLNRAIQKGAAAVLVEKDIQITDPDTVVIKVKNTLRALGDLAAYRRSLLASHLKVVAITGSSGKTTVKEMTAAILRHHYQTQQTSPDRILVTKGNFNNLIGLPLSLLPVLAHHTIAVLEMGMNRPGEINRLTEIAQPDTGCITNVQPAHLEGLGTIENVALAKTELFETMPDSGVRIVNLDDKNLRKWNKKRQLTRTTGFAVTAQGRNYQPEIRATQIKNLQEKGMLFTLHIRDWKKRISIPAPGHHNVSNAAAASAIADSCGVPPETISHALAHYQAYDKRMEFDQLPGGINIVNDAYNANPASMSAAITTVSQFGDQRCHTAVLGDMLELGNSSETAHTSIGALTADCHYKYLAVTGKYATTVADGAIKAGMNSKNIGIFENKKILTEWLLELIENKEISNNDWILVKGSRGMRMEEVIATLKARLSA